MPSKNQIKKQKTGFTIIEVVLVLAIAGLIFLMVFVALPALQRSQRDTQRRQDLSRAITAVQNYQANNDGTIPSFDDNFVTNYLKVGGDSFQDPGGTAYAFYNAATGTTKGIGSCGVTTAGAECKIQAPSTFTSGRIVAVKNATCKGEKAVYASGANQFVLLMKLEGAGIACLGNS